ncbi:hypothetical protein like AT2G23790 [Hibiscus trionum]|uniref:Calcium uniporter protein C-terminal domain-containing protein n=1 Tax=Hibiscus trionum TaxID=183268 RepID=A0A9W7M0J0_HIBTR|nr:hypothetical protein like AT2G23790 [Hibiscus trionum]
MALRKTLVKRPLSCCVISSCLVARENSSVSRPYTILRREYVATPDSGERGFLGRFFHRRAFGQLSPRFPEIFSVPVGQKLREKLRGINVTGDRLRLDGLAPPKDTVDGDLSTKISGEDARKLLRVFQMAKLKSKFREMEKSWISYHAFSQVCHEECGNEAQASELAKMLDQSGNVIVLGNVVFLRPEQVIKSVENILSESIVLPNDPRRKEVEDLEKQKSEIDKKAESLVRGELYCGLGLVVVQTLGFMRLTFWELNWDVMEPICFFVTSLHFALAYAFFLRTSTEPTFHGYFQQRFKAKQKKLMRIHCFDIQKYNKLRRRLYPNEVEPSR